MNKWMTPFVLLVAVLILCACTAQEEAPTAKVEVAAVSTETRLPTSTEMPDPTNTPTPEPTITPSPYPVMRGLHQMIYDPVADVILLFGGRQDSKHIDDIWSYRTSTNTWTQIGSINEADLTLTYHSAAKQVVLYAGNTYRMGWAQSYGRTLTYDYMTNAKKSMKAEGTPFGYAGAQLTYDEESNMVILFGGFFMEISDIGQLLSTRVIEETLAYDLNTNNWTNMAPTTNPPGRNDHAMVYHPTLDRVVMFGGDLHGGEGLDETWMYDYNTNSWELIPVLNSPPGRKFSAMVYVSSTDQILLFGGFTTKGVDVLNDLWALDRVENTWIELNPDNAPSKRAWHAMAYDSKADKVVLFGGGASLSKCTNESWIYDPQTNIWTDITPSN